MPLRIFVMCTSQWIIDYEMVFLICHFLIGDMPQVLYLITKVLLHLHVCVCVSACAHTCACVTILIFSSLLFDVSYTCNIIGSAQLGFLVILLLKLGRCPFIFTRYPIFTMLIFNSFWDIYCHCTLLEYRQLFKIICFTFSKTSCCFLYLVELIHWVNDHLYCLYTQILPARATNTEQDFNYRSNSLLV